MPLPMTFALAACPWLWPRLTCVVTRFVGTLRALRLPLISTATRMPIVKPDDITDGEFENAHYAYSEYGAGLIAALAAQNALRDRRVVEEAIGTTHVCECCEERTTRPYVHPEEGIDLCAPCVAALPREEWTPKEEQT